MYIIEVCRFVTQYYSIKIFEHKYKIRNIWFTTLIKTSSCLPFACRHLPGLVFFIDTLHKQRTWHGEWRTSDLCQLLSCVVFQLHLAKLRNCFSVVSAQVKFLSRWVIHRLLWLVRVLPFLQYVCVNLNCVNTGTCVAKSGINNLICVDFRSENHFISHKTVEVWSL